MHLPGHLPLTPRWTPLRPHAEQSRLVTSTARFKVVPAGRRSGKTERAKRELVKSALRETGPSPAFFAAAPTREQAKRIYWDDLKLLTGPRLMMKRPSETDLTIWLINGAKIVVIGMDKPERIEGTPWNGGILDEYANMKPEAWGANVRPALADRNGWCWLVGVPEGRNHYYKMYKRAKGELNVRYGGEWDTFTWMSSDILPQSEITAAREDLDELTFQQEYEASFVNFTGQCYYPFLDDLHVVPVKKRYNLNKDLVFAFDFNVDPGIAVIMQEMELPPRLPPESGISIDGHVLLANKSFTQATRGTGVIGEVYIPRNSNTRSVCRKLIHDWGEHIGKVCLYGDATGGARGTSQTDGSDWDIIKEEMHKHYGSQRVSFRVPSSNPTERARINAVNARLKSATGNVRMMVDPSCTHLIQDFEGVRLLEGGSGEIDKRYDLTLTHLTDAVGYYVYAQFPLRRERTLIRELRA